MNKSARVACSYRPADGYGRNVTTVTWEHSDHALAGERDHRAWMVSIHYADAPMEQFYDLADVPDWLDRPAELLPMIEMVDQLMASTDEVDAQIVATLAREYGSNPRDVATVLRLIRRAGFEVTR